MLVRGLSQRTWIAASLALGVGASVALAQSTGSLPSPSAQPAAGKDAAAAPGGAAQPSRSGTDAAMADCLRLWDKGTHMSKQEWARTCQRIQSRLDNLKIDNLKGMGTDAPKKSRAGAKGSSSAPN